MNADPTGKYRIKCMTIYCLFFLCSFILSGCGPVECDFCGRTRFCKDFDILGVERHICNDCLNDPRIAVSGNMVRKYSEMYENGALEYPEGSPLRPDYGTPTVSPTGTDSRVRYELPSDIDVLVQENIPAADSIPPTPTPTQSTAPVSAPVTSAATGLSGESLINALNGKLAADNMSLSPVPNKTGEYTLLNGGNDTSIRFVISAGTADKDTLTIEQRENASSSDYVKASIRSILAYTGSDDYEGLGHDIYNGAIQSGNFSNSGLSFISKVHTADEIEKGSPVSDFTIAP